MGRFWSRLAALLGLAALYVSPVNAQSWDNIRGVIRKRFPGVRQLGTAELARWMEDPGRKSTLHLIDARAPEEFRVSHLAGAHNARTVDEVAQAIPRRDEPVIVYCSVGYRSSDLANKLQKAGWTNVMNLDGSIFAWANEGRALHAGTNRLEPVCVHPYDAKWGQLLNARYHPPKSSLNK